MQIEIAWLADPMTFPYPMAARLAGETLEIAGLVPSEAVRQRALYLAHECSGMSVADRLHVQAGMPEPGGREPDGVLARKAAEAVSSTLAKHGHAFETNADAAGCVTISGRVTSYEENRAVSSRLSRIAGCCCVVNKLEVMKAARDGKQWVNVSADGIRQVPAEIVRQPVIRPQAPAIVEHQPATPAGPMPTPLPPVQQRAWVATDLPPVPPAAPKPAALPPVHQQTAAVSAYRPTSTAALLPPDQQTPAVSAYRPTSTAAPMAASLPPAQQQTPAASAYWATSTTAPMAASLPPAPQQTPAV